VKVIDDREPEHTVSESRTWGAVDDQKGDTPPDPFDPESLRLNQSFASAAAVKKVLTTVPCRKGMGEGEC